MEQLTLVKISIEECVVCYNWHDRFKGTVKQPSFSMVVRVWYSKLCLEMVWWWSGWDKLNSVV